MISHLHSVAGCSSWYFHAPTRTLFDCGEGVSEYMRNSIFAVENICISHSHWDHIGGLIGFIFSRQKNRGDNGKPLNVYYPINIDYLITQIIDMIGEPKFELNFIPLQGDKGIAFTRRDKQVHFFRTFHNRHITYGYAVVETRQRLNDYGRSVLESNKENFKNVVNDTMFERYVATDMAYLLDSYDLSTYEYLDNARTVIFDATFINDADRDSTAPSHMSWSMVADIIKNYKIKTAVLAHISPRYDASTAHNAIQVFHKKYNLNPNIVIMWCNKDLDLHD